MYYYFVIVAVVWQVMLPINIMGAPTGGADSSSVSVDWTYRSAFTHLVERHGIDDPVAALIADHIQTSERSWDDIYRGDITLGNGGVLTLSGGHRELEKRQDPANGPWFIAYPYDTRCNDVVSFTWQPSQPDVCYTYNNGTQITMFSGQANLDVVPAGACQGYYASITLTEFNDNCVAVEGDFWLVDNPSGDCFNTLASGIGWMNWAYSTSCN